MAESQFPFPYTPDHLAALERSLSSARFATYLKGAGNDKAYALALYLYNARLAKAFLYPLGVVEVTLRNAIDEILIATYGPAWPRHHNFRHSVLTAEGLLALDKAIDRAGGIGATKDQIVATLTFDFWSNLFRKDYADFWRTKLTVVLPHKPRDVDRHDIQSAVKEINHFRNRIAHHEPITDLNATDVMGKIKSVVSYRCPLTAAWMRHHTTVDKALRSHPKPQDANRRTLAARHDPGVVRVTGTETILEVMGKVSPDARVVVRIDANGAPTGACTSDDIATFLAIAAGKLEGLVSLQDHTVDAVMGAPGPASHWMHLDDDEPMARAVTALRQQGMRILVSVNRTSRQVTGAIVRAHRRY